MSSLRQVEQHLESQRAQSLAALCELLSIPSVSADSRHRADCRRAAEWVRTKLADAGLTTELVETPGHPIVYAASTAVPGAPTVLVYGHYDVQPPDPLALWTTPPFEPTVRDGRLYARGATDDKGQVFTHILSAAAWMRVTGGLPVNLKFVVEGEEEVGSNNLDDFLAARREQLRCDVAIISDTAQYGDGVPAITYGLRGIVAAEVTVHGPDRDLHSGVFGGAIANPVNALCRMIAALHDEAARVPIPGFYDDVLPLTDDERAEFAALPFDAAEFCRSVGVSQSHGEAGFTTLEQRWARPTCDVNGIMGGYQGEGPKTIIPAQAKAKITCRLVPNQDPHKIVAALEAFLRRQAPPGVRVEFQSYHGAPAVLCDRSSRYMAAAREAIRRGFGREPVLIREGGSIPVVGSLKQILGVDTLLLGWGRNSDNLHSPNEHFHLDDFHRGTAASAALWGAIAAASA